MMMQQGKRNPIKKIKVLGDFPFFLRIVHENVSACKPSSPQIPNEISHQY